MAQTCAGLIHSINTTNTKFKLQKFNCHYNIRKDSFGSRVNIWNILPDYVVEADRTLDIGGFIVVRLRI